LSAITKFGPNTAAGLAAANETAVRLSPAPVLVLEEPLLVDDELHAASKMATETPVAAHASERYRDSPGLFISYFPSCVRFLLRIPNRAVKSHLNLL
jgi:hypothetical protein